MNADMDRKKMAETTDPLEKLRYILFSKGVRGIKTLERMFRIFDDGCSNSLDLKEFTKEMNEYSGGELSDDQIKQIFSMVDIDGSGSIDSDEFIVAINNQMNPTRLAIVEEAFQKLEKYMNGELELNQRQTREMNQAYDANQDGKITKEEFLKYYSAVSANIDNDSFFDLMIKQTWNL